MLLGLARLGRWALGHHLPAKAMTGRTGLMVGQCCDATDLKNSLADVTLPHAAFQSDSEEAPQQRLTKDILSFV